MPNGNNTNNNGSGSGNGSGGNNPQEQAQIQNDCDYHSGNPDSSPTQDDEHTWECPSCHWWF